MGQKGEINEKLLPSFKKSMEQIQIQKLENENKDLFKKKFHVVKQFKNQKDTNKQIVKSYSV